MNAEREGLQSAPRGVPYGPHAEPGHHIEKAIERHAAKASARRERRETETVEAGARHATRYGAGF